MYANEMNLGQRGSFSINGFGEPRRLTSARTCSISIWPNALCWPASYSAPTTSILPPCRPDHREAQPGAGLDVETGAITKDQAERAKAEGLHLSGGERDAARRLTSSTWFMIN